MPPSFFDASDMIDLDPEPPRSPRLRPSKPKKKDPLSEMLAGVLDASPKQTKQSGSRHVEGAIKKPVLKISTDRNAQGDGASDRTEPSSEDGGLSPENVWKKAVEDDSPPAILHKVVALLHRSLKPREEVIQDIVSDYQENALRLLQNLSARHDQEKTDTLAAIRKSAAATFSVFSAAGIEMRKHIGSLRELDLTYTEASLIRPLLIQKLDAVARLCRTKLSKYVQGRSLRSSDTPEHDAASETEMENERAESLEDAYRSRLYDAIRRPDDKASDAYQDADAEVDRFITQCLRGESSTVLSSTEVRKTDTSPKSADEALEQFLDRVMSALREGNVEGGFNQAAHEGHGHNIGGVSEDLDMADV
ncbi:hypothetical protein VTK56DRAFT_1716 [Thermocarpiscus australiensis]